MESTRRATLAGVVGATSLLQGCLRGPNVLTDREARRRELVSSTSFTETVPAGGIYGVSYEFPVPVEVDYGFEVRDPHPVDVVLLERREYLDYRHGFDFDHVEPASVQGATSEEVTARVEPGSYRFVIDNTDRLAATPPDSDAAGLTVSAEFAAYVV